MRLSLFYSILTILLFLAGPLKVADAQPENPSRLTFTWTSDSFTPTDGKVFKLTPPETTTTVIMSANAKADLYGGQYGDTYRIRTRVKFYAKDANGMYGNPIADNYDEDFTLVVSPSQTDSAVTDTNHNNPNSGIVLGEGTYKFEYSLEVWIPYLGTNQWIPNGNGESRSTEFTVAVSRPDPDGPGGPGGPQGPG